jgi:hypothetical protein
MNTHFSAHLPIVPIVAGVAGAIIIGITTKQPWAEIGKALLWGGAIAALFASSGSC